jgi:hypothetical protein
MRPITSARFSARSYPNPFNPIATIEFTLPVSSNWQVMIYNVSGQKVATFDGFNEPGSVTVKWDASDYSSGIYLYKVVAGQNSVTRKMVLLK